jgi:hypothetical protein
MASTRNYTIIRTTESQEECQHSMAWPYSFISDEFFSLNNIRMPILEETAGAGDAGDFPNNIQEHFWVRVGENDGDDHWLSVGQLTNGNYFLYKGLTGNDTGFFSEGCMALWVSKTWETLVDHVFTDEIYELYVQQNDDFEEEQHLCGCGDEATMPNDWNNHGDLCADCYWELDSAFKLERRADPQWRYSRAYSAAVVLLGKTHEEALVIADTSVKSM